MSEEWTQSEWYKEWVRLAHNKPNQQDVGYWYYDNNCKCWKFQKPS